MRHYDGICIQYRVTLIDISSALDKTLIYGKNNTITVSLYVLCYNSENNLCGWEVLMEFRKIQPPIYLS